MRAKYKTDLILIIHFTLGVFFVSFPNAVFYFVLLFFIYGVFSVSGFVKGYPAYLFAAYLAGMELVVRMTQSGLPHEFTKYAIIVLLLIELFRKKKSIPVFIFIYGLCLLPAIFLVETGSNNEWRKLLSLNISGPLCLIVATVYFYDLHLNKSDIRNIFLNILYACAVILAYLFVATPDLSEIDFGYQSNFETSIYGPNQMASILGLGILIIGVCFLLKIRLFGNQFLALILLSLLTFRGLLTLSRGGILASVFLLSVAFLITLWRESGNQRMVFRSVLVSILIAFTFYFAFDYTNKVTGNALYNRYTGKIRGKQVGLDRITSGRIEIARLDFELFEKNLLLGLGVGMAKFERKDKIGKTEVVAHNEFTRLLAEHGLFGLVAAIILIFAPVFRYFKKKYSYDRILVLTMTGFCLIFMTHSATRIAAPSFLYGLAFISVARRQIPPVTKKVI